MIKFCLKQWENNKDELRAVFESVDSYTFERYRYEDLVRLIVDNIFNPGLDNDWDRWDSEHITIIDDGNYQGTLLFVIPRNIYQPQEYDYLMSYIGYGSCCVCDPLQAIQMDTPCDKTPLDDSQIEDVMKLCKDIVTNTIKPWNSGWRYDSEFDTVEY